MLRIDKRAEQKIRVCATLRLDWDTLSISRGGVCVLSAKSREAGEIWELKFSLPGFGDIACKGQVVSCRPSKIDPELFEVGLSFVDISDENRKRVAAFVEANFRQEQPKVASSPRDPSSGNR